jgi:hypothetical protein
MITQQGYSKDPTIIPEGIAVTFGKELIEKFDGVKRLLREFDWCMRQDDAVWNHKSRHKPAFEKEILHVYIILLNRLYGRCLYAGFETTEHPVFNWPRIILAGPFEQPCFKRELRGFRGFRYTTKLF